jgi:molybdate transport system substrate-binding protein
MKNILFSAIAFAVVLGACAAPPVAQPREITVFAAASLRDAFTEIGSRFEQTTPGAQVRLNFAGSQQLAEQIRQGAPADVFASANPRQMNDVMAAGRVTSTTAQIFAQNRLVVVVAPNAPATLQSIADLAAPGVKLVLADRAVPAGQYALDFLDKASALPEFGATFSQTVLSNVVSYEEDVRAVFGKVSLGEADAGVVYSSDAVADKNTVRTLAIPDGLNTLATYPIAPLNDSPNAALAKAFIDFVMGTEGQAILSRYGFIPTTP